MWFFSAMFDVGDSLPHGTFCAIPAAFSTTVALLQLDRARDTVGCAASLLRRKLHHNMGTIYIYIPFACRFQTGDAAFRSEVWRPPAGQTERAFRA